MKNAWIFKLQKHPRNDDIIILSMVSRRRKKKEEKKKEHTKTYQKRTRRINNSYAHTIDIIRP